MGRVRLSLLRRSVGPKATDHRTRFWVEAGLSGASLALFVLTLVVPDWIEAVFGIDPDQHSGSLEWAIDGLLLAAALTAGVLARLDWQRPRRVSSDLN